MGHDEKRGFKWCVKPCSCSQIRLCYVRAMLRKGRTTPVLHRTLFTSSQATTGAEALKELETHLPSQAGKAGTPQATKLQTLNVCSIPQRSRAQMLYQLYCMQLVDCSKAGGS